MLHAETKLITMTEQDITEGAQGDPESCPVARAISRETGCESVFVDNAIWVNGQYAFGGDGAHGALDWAVRFDQKGAAMKPLQPFDLTYWVK